MATPYVKIYDRFLAKILDDQWDGWETEEVLKDLDSLLESAIPWFKFPRTSLARDENGFTEDLSSEEQEILAAYMRVEWLSRSILIWENLRPLYDERDFSPANLIDKLSKTLENVLTMARRLEGNYYRSIDGKPFDYKTLAGN